MKHTNKSTTPTGLHNPAQGNALGNPPANPRNPVRVAQIDDITYAQIERTLNCSIHELVWALHHIDDNHFSEALDCLATVTLNTDTIGYQISNLK